MGTASMIIADDGSCPHTHTEPVTLLLTGQEVGHACTACLATFPLWWRCPDCTTEDLQVVDKVGPVGVVLAQPCAAHAEWSTAP